jgi:hypothetical protein
MRRSWEHPSDPVSALISEPGHGQAYRTHVSAGRRPVQRASARGARLTRPVFGAPVRKGLRQCVHIVRVGDRDIALPTREPIG